ncbi:MAG TPA: hypothetical protein VMU19_13285 [Bryobacteraceae bacterium]|nr:hypothetical protein [Bryobacteraceae bacterium]
MNWLLLILFGASCLVLIVRPLKDRAGVLHFPVLAGAGSLGFLFFQAVGLVRNPALVPPEGLTKTLIMCTLCNAAVFIGWYQRPSPAWRRAPKWNYRLLNVYWIGIMWLVIGGIGLLKLMSLAGGLEKGFSVDTEITEWSGLPVIYLFIGTFNAVGIALTCLAALKMRDSWWRFAPAAPFLLLQVATVAFNGRRTVLVALTLLALCIPFFARNYLPPKAVVLASAVFILVGIYLFPIIRQYTPIGADRSKLESVSVEDTSRGVVEGQTAELWAATYLIDITDIDHQCMYGARTYNQIISLFVPKILVGGADAKARLLLNVPEPGLSGENAFNWVRPYYFHVTGPASVFMEFSYAGALLYWWLARVMRRLWVRATEFDDIRAQIIYALFAAPAVAALTSDFANVWVALPVSILAPIASLWCVKVELLPDWRRPNTEHAALDAMLPPLDQTGVQ